MTADNELSSSDPTVKATFGPHLAGHVTLVGAGLLVPLGLGIRVVRRFFDCGA